MKKVKRLFELFAPEHYTLEITPDAEKMTFSGYVEVKGKKTGRPSQRITLHQKDLKVTKAELIKHDKTGDMPMEVVRVNTHDTYNEVRIHADGMVYPGNYTIKLWFEGVITKPMHGIYPCPFTHEGKEKKLLATQFESHYAREAFPCIDEPEAKATFHLTLNTPKDEVVLSNTPVEKQTLQGPSLQTTFEKTPIMSTYLLAFVIGEMHSVEDKAKDGTLIRTWSTVAQPKSSLEFANKEAANILEFFTDYFGVHFPLKKLDQVALPDFEAGAMENWGLITYREVALLADAENRSLTSEQYVAMVIGHEVSHQWFGDLVTMKWWDDLWLNESFASLMEHIALDALHPDWHQWEQYAASDIIICSNRDIYKDVQSVGIEVKRVDEIEALFDPAIVYTKGGRLLKMLREHIGDDAFRKGLKAYFEEHAYKNTTREDLWKALSDASGQDIHALMTPWLEQSGMPVITLRGDPKHVTARQDRFVLDSKDDQTLWPIPVLSDGVEPKIFTEREVELTDSNSPFVLNQNGSGHYIVNYADDKLKDQVDKAFASQELPSETRINYLNDLLLLARRGDSPLTETLEVVRRSGEEPRDAVWALMSRAAGIAYTLTEGDEETHKKIKAFRCEVAGPLHAKLGWDDKEGDDTNTKLLRLSALGWMLAGEEKSVVDEALRRHSTASSIDELDAEHRGMILANLMKYHPEKHLEQLIDTYKKSPNPEVQLAICVGLCAVRDRKIGQQIIAQALGEDKPGFVRAQDLFRWYAHLMRNTYTRDDTWDWFVKNWDRIYDEFSGKSLDHFVVYASGPITTADWQKKFLDFFLPKSDIITLSRNIKIAESEIAARIAWRIRDEPKIKQFFSS